MNWQPIETAPRDGTAFFTYSEDAAKAQHLNSHGSPGTPILVMAWISFWKEPQPVNESGDDSRLNDYMPTHWCPLTALPPPPVSP